MLSMNNVISKILEPTYHYLRTALICQTTWAYQNVNKTQNLLSTMYHIKKAMKYQNLGCKIKIFINKNYTNNSHKLLWPLKKNYRAILNEKRGIHLTATVLERKPSKVEEFNKFKQKKPNEKMSINDAELLDEALGIITRNKKFREGIEELKKKLEVVSDHTHNINKNKVTNFLHKKLNKIVGQLDKDLNALEKNIEEKKTIFSVSEIKADNKCNSSFSNNTEMIKITELIKTIKNLQEGYDEAKLKTIENLLRKMDINRNGLVSVADVIIIIEAIIANNVKLHKK